MRTTATIWLVASFALLMLSGCGGGEETDGLERSTLIGPGGGTIRTADNRASVLVPDAAIGEPQIFTSQQLRSPQPAPGLVAGTAYLFGPEGWTFDAEATITIRYSDSQIPSGVAESSLRIARLSSGVWQPISPSSVDTELNTVSAPITGFSTFAIVGEVAD